MMSRSDSVDTRYANGEITELKREIDHLEVWAFIQLYVAPPILAGVLCVLVWSIVNSALSDESPDSGVLSTQVMSIAIFGSCLLLTVYLGRKQKIRANLLRSKMGQIRKSRVVESVSRDCAPRDGRILDSFRHLLVVVYPPSHVRQVVLLTMLIIMTIMGVAGYLVFVFVVGVSFFIGVMVFLPLVILILFTYLLYRLIR